MDNKRPRDLGFIFFGVAPSIICASYLVVSLTTNLYMSDEEKLQAAIASMQLHTAVEQAKIDAMKLKIKQEKQ